MSKGVRWYRYIVISSEFKYVNKEVLRETLRKNVSEVNRVSSWFMYVSVLSKISTLLCICNFVIRGNKGKQKSEISNCINLINVYWASTTYRYCNNTAICSSRIESEITINGRIKESCLLIRSPLPSTNRLSQTASAELKIKCYSFSLLFSHPPVTNKIRYFF